MNYNYSKVLQEMGLPETAALIYLELIKSPKLTISEIARATRTKRATCYQYIDQLLSKDFIVRVPVGKRMFYSAVSPKKILSIAKKQYSMLENAMGEMTKQYDESTHKPQVMFYEGKRELKNIYDNLFKTVGDVYSIFPPAAFFENFTEKDYEDFEILISEYAIKSRDLIADDGYFHRIEQLRKKTGIENKVTKKLPGSFKSNIDVLIFNDNVALVSLRDLSALVIQSKDIADLFRSIHGTIWKSC